MLAARIPTLSRSRLKALILDGHVAIEARTILDPASAVKSGDIITVTLPPPEEATPLGENIPLTIVYEDDELIVIDKPKGLVVHPRRRPCHRYAGQCADRPLRRQPVGIGGVKRPGHRA